VVSLSLDSLEPQSSLVKVSANTMAIMLLRHAQCSTRHDLGLGCGARLAWTSWEWKWAGGDCELGGACMGAVIALRLLPAYGYL
jgi:hypothetical protein